MNVTLAMCEFGNSPILIFCHVYKPWISIDQIRSVVNQSLGQTGNLGWSIQNWGQGSAKFLATRSGVMACLKLE